MTLGINILKCYGENILLKYKNFLGTALVLKKADKTMKSFLKA